MSADVIMVMPKYNMFGTQPYSNVEYVRSLEGIEKVTHMTMMTSDPLGSMFDGMIFATDGNLFDFRETGNFDLVWWDINIKLCFDTKLPSEKY